MTDRDDIQALINELYALISGPGDQPRDWDRQRELFLPGTRMIRTRVDADGPPEPEILRLEDYGENYHQLMGGRDFYEIEVENTIQIFGQIAQVFSVYEAFSDPEHRQRLKRGVNVIQLYKLGDAWKITAMAWDDER